MARRDALLRLCKTLQARRMHLSRTLAEELTNLHEGHAGACCGDSADAAFEESSEEMASQLAEWNCRELDQIERALASLKEGRYGLCEGGGRRCQKRIPVARLNAIPHATLCIHCERELEQLPHWHDRRARARWNQVHDPEAAGSPLSNRGWSLNELESSDGR